MFDEDFFKTHLKNHIDAKAKSDQPSLVVTLHSDHEYSVCGIAEIGPGWIVLEAYPPGHKQPRRHTAEDRKAGAPQFDFDRVAVPYENINLAVVTLEKSERALVTAGRANPAMEPTART